MQKIFFDVLENWNNFFHYSEIDNHYIFTIQKQIVKEIQKKQIKTPTKTYYFFKKLFLSKRIFKYFSVHVTYEMFWCAGPCASFKREFLVWRRFSLRRFVYDVLFSDVLVFTTIRFTTFCFPTYCFPTFCIMTFCFDISFSRRFSFHNILFLNQTVLTMFELYDNSFLRCLVFISS